MIENWVFEDLLDVLIADFWRILTRRAQMLPTVDRKIDLSVSKVFGLVVREEQNCTVSYTSSHLGPIPSLLVAAYDTFVEVDARYSFFAD